MSHYWDCRLKGRPPGTKKSTDPDKKKRKRVARERDLCDVKIKITEYFDGAELIEQTGMQPPVSVEDTQMEGVANAFFGQAQVNPQAWGMHSVGLSMGQEKSQKYYTIQRVNGNGGNGKGDGVAGPHKHTLEESDRVKKNSVIRWLMKHEKERKKGQVSFMFQLLFFFLCFDFPPLSARKPKIYARGLLVSEAKLGCLPIHVIRYSSEHTSARCLGYAWQST